MSLSITLVIVIVTALLSYKAFNDRALFNALKHYPVAEHSNKEYYRMLSSGFIHGSWIHLGINLFVLYEFGRLVESYYGHVFGDGVGRMLYLVMYLLTIIMADLPTFFKHKNNPSYAAIGASGAVSGVVFIFILIQPWQMLYLYGIVPIPAIVGGVLYLLYSTWASKNRNDNVDHSAHLWGAVFGMLFTIAIHPPIVKQFYNSFMSGIGF